MDEIYFLCSWPRNRNSLLRFFFSVGEDYNVHVNISFLRWDFNVFFLFFIIG
jgi:hypothetical protein